jgi:predicted RNA-binding protein with PUA-like domain
MGRWLMKSEPDVFSIDDLAAAPDRTTMWEGVRNTQARNWMRDRMAVGDDVLFYHSSCAVPAVVGVAEVVRAAYPDPTQFDPGSHYADPTSKPDDPRWVAVDVRFVCKLDQPVTLAELRRRADRLGDLALVRRGNRLSVMPVSDEQWDVILEGGEEPPAS